MSAVPDRPLFEESYKGEPPWEIGRPQRPFVAAADRVLGPILDAGCGTGENALHFASLGRTVTGIDFIEEAIRRARAKAADRKLAARFLVKDALALAEWDERFASVLDSGLFHCFDDEDRGRYVSGLATVLSPGGRLFLACFSDAEPGDQGPRRISERELREAFARGFAVESIEPMRFEVNPAYAHIFQPGGPRAWFAVVRRTGGE